MCKHFMTIGYSLTIYPGYITMNRVNLLHVKQLVIINFSNILGNIFQKQRIYHVVSQFNQAHY